MNIKELAEQAHEFAAWACEVDLRANYSTVREERFAELVAAAEREACAKLCEEENWSYAMGNIIRARSKHD